MAYDQKLLNDSEEIVLDRHPHWSFMLGAVVMIMLGVAGTIVIAVVDWRFAWIGLICIFFFLLGSVGRYLRWRCTQFVVTTDRIIVRTGVLSKSGLEIPLDRVTNISFHQALWERLLGTGDLVIESAGESGHQLFTDVSNPSQVQNLIYRQTELSEANKAAAHNQLSHSANGGTNHSIPEQIEKLDELRQRGILSELEFRQKKQELLDRL